MRNLLTNACYFLICILVQSQELPAKFLIQPTVTDSSSPSLEYSYSFNTSKAAAREVKSPPSASEGAIEEAVAIGNNMVCLEGGTYVMGCLDEKGACWENEKPNQTVTVKGFYISKFEVTQRQWKLVMGTNPSYFQNCEDCPVEQVSWDEVQEFITKLNRLSGKNFRLPTEAEWEFAARDGGKNVQFGNGSNTATLEDINFNAQFAPKKPEGTPNAPLSTRAVGSLKANTLGLYDMSGNVWEWCSDNFQKYGESAPETANMKVMRGGSWKNPPQFCRTTVRIKEASNKGNMLIGFRLAMDK